MLVKTKIVFLFLAFFLAAIIFTTCNSPMGMGDPIDWEPPVLTMDKVPNPLYVGEQGVTLTGKATDNIGVVRIVFIDSATAKEMPFPVERDGDNWKINIKFTKDQEDQNGSKIVGEIRAYDKMNNSGDMSVAIVTLIIDIRPPVIENMTIKRTDTRIAYFLSLRELEKLETTDRLGEKKDEVYKYQNGWFYINGVVNDEETKIEIISLDFYDANHDDDSINQILLSLSVDNGYTNYFPRWTVKEEDLINAGVNKWGNGYKTKYYDDEVRYYYRVVIKAIDMSNNKSIVEDEGYICLWAQSDKPKGILDPAIGTVVSRGIPLPIDFFDDDSLLWAYTGLITEDQWNGTAKINATQYLPTGTNNEEKLEWLKKHLRKEDGGDGVIYNWKYDKHSGLSDEIEKIEEQIQGKSLDEKLVFVSTGNGEFDYGDYILFTLAADKKLAPHDGKGPEWTNKEIWTSKYYNIAVIDENAPLIVFDTENGCPEENTFPILDNGEFFTIKGYTLRENKSGMNKVTAFRMAWIPFGMPDLGDGKPKGADGYIKTVQEALSKDFAGMPAGVQYWDFSENGGPGTGTEKAEIKEGVNDPIDGNDYNKQEFSKKFSVLGYADDIKTTTDNFKYNGKLENETKLLIFYAVDNMGHEVFRQLRLLSNKTPPNLVVYDISNMVDNVLLPGMPDLNDSKYANPSTGGLNDSYYSDLNAYNAGKYSILKNSSSAYITDDDIAYPFQIYPRGTIVKYWVEAAKSGDIAVDNITMKDISTSDSETAPEVGSGYQVSDMALSFCESYPDVTQRTFLFEARDKLGNVAHVQRTIAVTNAARLENITTTAQNGTYGISIYTEKTITLKANFSSQVYLDGGTQVYLNVRYKRNNGNLVYVPLPCKNPPNYANPSLSIEFEFLIEEGYEGDLETTYDGMSPQAGSDYIQPLRLGPSTKIMDYIRKDAAFIPGYKNDQVTMPNWTNAANTLQAKKKIVLDGIRPTIIFDAVGGKETNLGNYYFKEGETITFTLKSVNKPSIMASNNTITNEVPKLEYWIRPASGNDIGPLSYFDYIRPDGQDKIVFGLLVIGTNCPVDGELVRVRPSLGGSNGNVFDNVGNPVDQDVMTSDFKPDERIFIKRNSPAAPAATLSSNSTTNPIGTNPNVLQYYASTPTLEIPDSPNIFYGIPWEDGKEYSLNGGITWKDFTKETPPVYIPGSEQDQLLWVRYKDRAGNEGKEQKQLIHVESNFPKLVAVGTKESNGWYTSTTGNNKLEFRLSFDSNVRVTDPGNVKITLRDINKSGTDNQIVLDAATGQTTNRTTVIFNWDIIPGKDMQNGLYISDLNLSGLSDIYNNTGSTGTGTASSTSTSNIVIIGSDTCANLPYGGIKVDAIAPIIEGRTPEHNNTPSGDDAVTEIKLTFSETVMKGSGTITIRPSGNYAIPSVIRDTGYYIGTNGNEYANTTTDPSIKKTYISSFYDIYNNSALNDTDQNDTNPTKRKYREYLTEGTSMSNLALNERTGQSKGPYKKTTHGLIEGQGYTGNYSNTTPGANGPNLGTGAYTAMIPDTATKWVLDYQYQINETSGAVANIRNALSRAKWRWQEIDVVNAVISGNTVTITLNEPLLKGLDWDVYYPEGTFTDMAGNLAVKSGNFTNNAPNGTNTDYHFTTPGVQPPVIRVDRRSYDGRNGAWRTPPNANGAGNFTAPGDTANWGTHTIQVADNGLATDGGWGISDFNSIHYRVESESPNAVITAKNHKGAYTDKSGAKGGWGDTGVFAANGITTLTGYTDANWSVAAASVPGTWILPNIIRRSQANNGGQSYTVTTKNNTPELRNFVGAYRGFRSYNRDLTKGELDFTNSTLLSSATFSNGQGVINAFDPLESSKSYVVAQAEKNGKEATGCEGIFRTVIAFNFGGTPPTNDNIFIEGSNIKNGMPSIAGFPVRDAEETGDARFVKRFYMIPAGGGVTTRTQYYWVSTEIVCEWYFLSWGGGGTHQSVGEVNNYLTVGYGDLTFGYAVTR